MLARLIPISEAARHAMRQEVRLGHFPFRVGRENFAEARSRVWQSIERRFARAVQGNDLTLPHPWTDDSIDVSREHFQIEHESGKFYLTDRGSACGTIVAGRQIGGARLGGRVELRDYDRIVVGTASSAYVFEFRTR